MVRLNHSSPPAPPQIGEIRMLTSRGGNIFDG